MSRALIIAALACVTLPTAGFAKAFQAVGQCKPTVQHFDTIGAALAAQPQTGSTIYLCPNTYPEQVTITHPTTLIGVDDGTSSGAIITVPPGGLVANAQSSDPNVPYAAQIAAIGAGTVNISNMTIDGTSNQINECAPILVGILFQNTGGTVADNRLINQNLVNGSSGLGGCQSGNAIELLGDTTQTVKITDNDVAGFQKNGITIDSMAAATISNNTVTGEGASPQIAQNGIEADLTPSVVIAQNVVSDVIYTGAYYGATGILIYDSPKAQVKGNTGTNTQGLIYDFADQQGASDGPSITANSAQTTLTFDGIDVCGVSGAAINGNTVNGSAESAVHLDSECLVYNPDGSTTQLFSDATVTRNKLNGACVGILVGQGSTLNGSSVSNGFYNTVTDTLTGSDTCPGTAPQTALYTGRHTARHVSPLRAHR